MLQARLPLGKTDNDHTGLEKPVGRVLIRLPVMAFQILTVPSSLPLAKRPFCNAANARILELVDILLTS